MHGRHNLYFKLHVHGHINFYRQPLCATALGNAKYCLLMSWQPSDYNVLPGLAWELSQSDNSLT